MQIKINSHKDIPLTVLNKIDVEGLVYENQINGDGFCQFTCRVDNEKLQLSTVSMFNKIRIFEGSKCVFYGFINDNSYNLNTITVRAISLSAILKDKIASTYTLNTPFLQAITEIINAMNSIDNTGISIGGVSISGTANKYYSNAETVEYVVKDLIGTNQIYIDPLGKLFIAPVIGTDKSNSIILRYDTRTIQNANLTNFSVKENGQGIISRILAKDNSNNAVYVENTALQAKYGVIEALKNYYSVSGIPALQTEALRDFQDREFSPDFTLSPNVSDDFDVGDVLGVRIYNKFIDINTAYQVLVKTVNYVGNSKVIKVKLNDKQKTILDVIKDQQKKITQLQNN